MAKLLCPRLDGDKLFEGCKVFQEEKKDLAGLVEGITMEKDELFQAVADLKAQLKELESRLEESKLWVAKEREASNELEDELIMYKKRLWSSMRRTSIKPSSRPGSSLKR